jgi:hypothetical protein
VELKVLVAEADTDVVDIEIDEDAVELMANELDEFDRANAKIFIPITSTTNFSTITRTSHLTTSICGQRGCGSNGIPAIAFIGVLNSEVEKSLTTASAELNGHSCIS